MPEMLPDTTPGQGFVHNGAEGAFSFVRTTSLLARRAASSEVIPECARVISDLRIQDSGRRRL
jgi:hypothetical protein